MHNGKLNTVTGSDAAALQELSLNDSEQWAQSELLRKLEEQAKSFFAKFEVPMGHEDQTGFHYDK